MKMQRKQGPEENIKENKIRKEIKTEGKSRKDKKKLVKERVK
jgi:hypothetical protein